jgi:hypothetical protein
MTTARSRRGARLPRQAKPGAVSWLIRVGRYRIRAHSTRVAVSPQIRVSAGEGMPVVWARRRRVSQSRVAVAQTPGEAAGWVSKGGFPKSATACVMRDASVPRSSHPAAPAAISAIEQQLSETALCNSLASRAAVTGPIYGSPSDASGGPPGAVTWWTDRKVARTSLANKSGSSQAAKWPPLSTSLK